MTRSFEDSVPAPTLRVPAGAALIRPTRLLVNVENTLQSSVLFPTAIIFIADFLYLYGVRVLCEQDYATTIRNEVLVADEFGIVETFITVDPFVPFDLTACCTIQVGNPDGANEIMQVVALNSTASFTVERGARGTTERPHGAGTAAETIDMTACNFPRQVNTTNVHVSGLLTASTASLNTEIPGSSPTVTVEFSVPMDHPRGTFWYHSLWLGSSAIQVGGGMAGMFIVEDKMEETPDALFRLQEVHLVLHQFKLKGRDTCLRVESTSTRAEIACDDWTHHDVLQDFLRDGLRNSTPVDWTPGPDDTPQLADDEEYLDAVLVNGQYRPNLALTAGAARRVRVVNSGAHTTLELTLECDNGDSHAGCTTHILAFDGMYLPGADGQAGAPMAVETFAAGGSLILFPGSRIDVALQCLEPGSYTLASRVLAENDALLGDGTARRDQDLLHIEVTASSSEPTPLPSSLPLLPDSLRTFTEEPYAVFRVRMGEEGASRTRRFIPPEERGGSRFIEAIQVPSLRINGRAYAGESAGGAPMHCIQMGVAEEWEIENSGSQLVTFHLQSVPFQVIAVEAPGEGDGYRSQDLNVWRDTFGLAGGARIRVRLKGLKEEGKFLLHATRLSDADNGLAVTIEARADCSCFVVAEEEADAVPLDTEETQDAAPTSTAPRCFEAVTVLSSAPSRRAPSSSISGALLAATSLLLLLSLSSSQHSPA